MEGMNLNMKKKIVLIVLSFICIIILISGFFYVRKEEKNKISSDEIIFSNLEKMNEVSPHLKWAKKIMAMSEVYGVLNKGVEFNELYELSM